MCTAGFQFLNDFRTWSVVYFAAKQANLKNNTTAAYIYVLRYSGLNLQNLLKCPVNRC